MKKWEGAITVDLALLEPNDWNPNAQTDATFNLLVDEIKCNGFDEPIIAVPHPDKPGSYRIIGGEHRWKAAKILDLKEVPIVIKEHWDETEQKTQTVRRNLLRGDLDKVRFTSLVNDVMSAEQIPIQELMTRMGFTDEREFTKAYQAGEAADEKVAASVSDETKDQLQMVDNVSYLLNEIFSKFGATVPQGFLFFMHKSKMHLMVQMDKDMEETMGLLVNHLKSSGQNINDVLTKSLIAPLTQPVTAAAPSGPDDVKYE